MFTDLDERNKIEEAQEFIAKRGWNASGEDFFQSLARFLANVLEADYVCIDRLEGDGLSARTVAVFFDGRFEDNVSYTLKETPCGDVVGKTVCCFPRSVRELFPHDAVLQEMAAESYAGTTLWSGDGRPIGLIAVIARKPLEDQHMAEMVLGLVSARAAGELERREAADELRKLVGQKETLLKELQHRVKNNLNVVSSLLDLETGRLPDDRTKNIFLDARNRILSISNIYERLYLSDDLATVELGPYIRDLAASIFDAYAIGRGRVVLSVEADEVKLETKRVVPLGLILNELISNALKYAYSPDKGGQLRIRLVRTGNRITLSVSDDGAGYPDGFDPENADGMGMILVRMLADEIRAQLRFESARGVTVSLEFDL
jgi:two-component sensor histidine kinase